MSETRLYCTFDAGGQAFGLDVSHVQELIRWQRITGVPLAPRVIRGLMNLRGQIVTVVDLRRRLGLPDHDTPEEMMNVVVQSSCGPVGLLVDGIGDVIELDPAREESPPNTIRGQLRQLIRGVHQRNGHLLLLLHVDRVLSVVVDLPDAGNANPANAAA